MAAATSAKTSSTTTSSPPPDKNNGKPIPAVLCPNCGSYCPVLSGSPDRGDENLRRIADLEAQVNVLRKTNTDYEDDLRSLGRSPRPSTADRPTTPLARFGTLLGQARKLSGSSASGTGGEVPGLLSGREGDLAAQLAKEQDLRQRAEGKAAQMSTELEDLSAQLFQQANEMVANERRARAKLEERVVILERRDVEKRERLERLEKALKRIDRVKGILARGNT